MSNEYDPHGQNLMTAKAMISIFTDIPLFLSNEGFRQLIQLNPVVSRFELLLLLFRVLVQTNCANVHFFLKISCQLIS